MQLPTPDGITVAVHELGGGLGRPPLLISHATGFHAHCYVPLARALSPVYHSWGLDHRGHGETVAPPGSLADWSKFGDDALLVASTVAPDGGLVGFGHSMGGSALLMAAAREPDRFERLVLFEPIAHPDPGSDVDMEQLPIVQGARRRRRHFASTTEAIENYSAKPPLALMTPEVLRCYVEHGFRAAEPGEGPDGADGGVVLRCSPEYEASVFTGAHSHDLFDRLPEIDVPTVIMSGAVYPDGPSCWAPMIAERLPRAEYLCLEHLSHLGPFSHPAEIAGLTSR